MAKRPTSRSKDTDGAAPAQPKAKRARGVTALPATAPPAVPEAAPTAEPRATVEPSVDDIRRRAYERYLERGGRHGQHFDDWLEAERELKRKSEK
jgi:hypothetical protein